MMLRILFFPIMIAILLMQIGCVRPCRNVLNTYAVDTHGFGDFKEVIFGQDGSVAFVGNHTYYRWVWDYEQKKTVKYIKKKKKHI